MGSVPGERSVVNNTSKVYEAPAETAGFQATMHGEVDTGAALFVINLYASIAPISIAGRNLPGLENYRLYQVSRMEDGRTRHRLRLGFFTSEAHAENVLALVRQQYPTAFTACLCEEDRKFARGYLPTAQREAAANISPAVTRPALAPAAALAAPVNSTSPVVLELSLSDPPAVAPREASEDAQPFHVGKGVDIADTGIRLQTEPGDHCAPAALEAFPSLPASRTMTAPASDSAASLETILSPAAKLAAVTPLQTAGARSATARPMRRSPPELDSTQTIRALTLAELEDEGLEKWFAIQLAASEQPVNLDTMPHLDIFDAYRLYSVASTNAGKIVHSLRLGFFKEDVSAEAVGGYLKTFFSTPTVLRVSEAEYVRFKEPPVRTGPAQGAEIVAFSPTHAPRSGIPTVTMEVPTPGVAPGGNGAFEPHAAGRATGKFDAANTGRFRPSPGTLDTGASASIPATSIPRAAPKPPLPARQRPSLPRGRTGMTGKHKAMAPRSLSEQLLEEARAVALSQSGIREAPKNGSLFSRLVGKLTR